MVMGCGTIRYLYALCYDPIKVSGASLLPQSIYRSVLSQVHVRREEGGFEAPPRAWKVAVSKAGRERKGVMWKPLPSTGRGSRRGTSSPHSAF